MKIQLLMIIALIASSLLTISQRANAQEVTKFRWLEPTVDQRYCEVAVPDQDKSSDSSNHIGPHAFLLSPAKLFVPSLNDYQRQPQNKVVGNANPRAPPFSLI
ncbi:hypothetical protein HGG82_02075 [Marinomonas sp. M1K-6]|uniref:Uncharacterized protein n=1 Tax=Marinomonas profundi TaxID=2726122 RepID=A0A847QWE5_9GAMM|nr:hypothetical protein [Marinomonas profundi]NLQ16409.1 hypothetical protein [Marinomonas profundi]UDV03018.1 hypothetical protein J8N69_15920 [Marinomonas profundi]